MINLHYKPGTLLESYLDALCDDLNRIGCHAHKNQPKQTFTGKFIEGEPFDYEIFAGGKVYCFDAKENMSGGMKWQIKMTGSRGRSTNARVLKQAHNLFNCKRNGAEAFFLVAFNPELHKLPYSLVKYDAELVYNALVSEKKYLLFDQGIKFDPAEFLTLSKQGV